MKTSKNPSCRNASKIASPAANSLGVICKIVVWFSVLCGHILEVPNWNIKLFFVLDGHVIKNFDRKLLNSCFQI